MEGQRIPTSARQIRVYLADDHPLVRAGISAVLAGAGGRFSVVGEGSNGFEVLEFAMPELNGIQTTEKLLQLDPGRRVVILSVHTHKYNLMKRLDIHSTAELVKFAVRTGLVPLDPG